MTRLAAKIILIVSATLAAGTGLAKLSGDDPPTEVRAELLKVLEARADAVNKETGEGDLPYKRASYFERFHKVDDDTYQVAFFIDSAGDRQMHDARYTLTLKRGSGGWEVGAQELASSYDGLKRPAPGREKFYTFDSFAFDREGMKASTKQGTLYTTPFGDDVYRIYFTGSDLRYAYTPPQDLHRNEAKRYKQLLEDYGKQLVFEPDYGQIVCDPETCREFLGMFVGLQETSRGSLDPRLEKRLTENTKNWKERYEDKNGRFLGFRDEQIDQTGYFLGIHGRDDDHLVYLSYGKADVREVTFGAAGFGGIFGYASEETRKAGIDPYDIDRREDEDSRDYEVTGVSGVVEVAVEDPDMVEGDLEFNIRLKRDAKVLDFGFSDISGALGRRQSSERNPSIRIHSLQTAKGEDVTCVRLSPSRGLIVFPEEQPAGTDLRLRMWFSNSGSIVKISHSYFYMDRGGWLPFIHYVDKIDDLDLTIRALSKYEALGIGKKVSEEKRGNLTETRWLAEDVHFPTIIIGDYFNDSPKTVAKKQDGTVIPVTVHVDRLGMSDWDIRPKQLAPLGAQAVNALNVYRELFGMDYPYDKLDLVNDPNFLAGQAPASIIYLGGAAFRSESEVAARARDAARTAAFMSSLVAHEVAHQWWGSLIGNRNNQGYWFVESLAEYSSALFLEILESEGYQKPEAGRKAYLAKVADWRREIMDQDLVCSVEDARTHWCDGGYRAALYAKGPYAFHILRMTFGDQRFFNFLKELAQELAGKTIVTRDIQRVAEKSFGGVDPQGNPYNVDLEWFFDQWIRETGTPEYSIQYSWRKTEDGKYTIQGTIKQRVVGPKSRELPGVFFRGRVPVTVKGKDGEEYSAPLVVEGSETPFAFKLPVEPDEIAFNKYGEILALDVKDLSAGS